MLLAYGSAMGYTATNVCLRAVTHCDPLWVSAVKAFPTVALVAPLVVCRVLRSQVLVASPRALGLLLVAAVIGQLGGNVLFQWALGVIGIALTVPLTLGTMIISGALMGKRLLGEHVSRRMVAAIFILVTAILILGLGAREANRAISGTSPDQLTLYGTIYLMAGVAAACICGVAYCQLGVAIRHANSRGIPVSVILGSVTLIGVLTLGGASYWRIGADGMWNTPSADLAMMLLAGVLNAAAFWSLTRALQLVSLVYTNALNASQAAMAALAGVLLFREAPTLAMAVGIALTIVGLLLMNGEPHDAAEVDPVRVKKKESARLPGEPLVAAPAEIPGK
jgi:drug/metabolite transporter (DMT)-like permease